MTYYPAPAINKALGLEAGASLDDALTTIAQLRASLVDVAELREAVHRLTAERDEARKTANAERDRINELSAELKQANEALGDVQRELQRANEAALYNREEADSAKSDRDAALAMVHRLTRFYA